MMTAFCLKSSNNYYGQQKVEESYHQKGGEESPTDPVGEEV